MIIRRFFDNGYSCNTDNIDIELSEDDFVDGGIEQSIKMHGIHKEFLKQSGMDKLLKYYPDHDFNLHYYDFIIISDKQLQFEAEQKWQHQYIINYTAKLLSEGKLTSDLVGISRLCGKFPITKEILLHFGWEEITDPICDKISKEELNNLKEETGWDLKYYQYDVKIDGKFINRIIMKYGLSNSINRNWACHIDNNCFESIASADIETIEHFNKLMQLMDIQYNII